MELQKVARSPWFRYPFALAAVILAAALRVWPLLVLGLRTPYLTFYPAVMVSSLLGGLWAGVLSTVFSALTIIFWSPTGRPFLNDRGDWLGMAVFLVNCTMIALISETMHRARERATKAKEQAEAANRAKTVFLANMSHELRTPLNAILGFSRLMANSSDVTAPQRENLDIVTRSGEQLLNLINNVLDISKIESGRVVLEETTIDLHQLLYEIHSLLHVRAVEKGLSFTMDLAPDLPRAITVDAKKLWQVLINLVGNAIKFTRAGRVGIQADVARRESPLMAQLRFKVDDSGPGIRREDRNRIFLPFVQLEDQPPSEAGTGLGLAIAKQYVELMDGTIDVTSIPGNGSVFRFTITVGTPGPTAQDQDEVRRGRAISLAQGQPRYRLLIIEDRFENRLLLHKLLESFGFDVQEAVNGQKGLELFEAWHPHLVWMDIRMPVMDGLEATKRIKKSKAGSHTKVIALTAHALEEERLEILAAGCDDVIRKPYRDTEIVDALEKHLNVQFQYAHEQPSTPAKTSLDALQMKKLPAPMLESLHEAAELLDSRRCIEVIGTMDEKDSELAEQLRIMVENLNFKEILAVLDELKERKDK